MEQLIKKIKTVLKIIVEIVEWILFEIPILIIDGLEKLGIDENTARIIFFAVHMCFVLVGFHFFCYFLWSKLLGEIPDNIIPAISGRK